jgi:hypothetical protein
MLDSLHQYLHGCQKSLGGRCAEMRELLPNLEAVVVRVKRLQKRQENREL